MATRLHWWILLVTLSSVLSLPELGVWKVTYDKNTPTHAFAKSVFKNTQITVTIMCSSNKVVHLDASWVIRMSPCAQEYDGIEDDMGPANRQVAYLSKPNLQLAQDYAYTKIEYIKNFTTIKCGGEAGHIVYLPDHSMDHVVNADAISMNTLTNETASNNKQPTLAPANPPPQAGTKAPTNRRRRAAEGDNAKTDKPATKAPTTVAPKQTTPNPTRNPNDIDHNILAKFWHDGYYVFVLQIVPSTPNSNFSAEVTVRMPGPHGYISAVEFPLEIFYGLMGLVYIVYGIVWLVLLGCNWRDLLRVQFWIEGVIVLGMLEKAVFFAEYESIAKSGTSVRGAVIVAELVSAMKRALARMLVIVVSLGFGIVKPRLGQTFHKVLCVGVMYFVLGSIEGCMRALKSKSDQSNELMLAAVPLAVLDAVICWWIFSSLVQTTRTLRLRRNIVKLSLYRHFTNTLIFAVLASIAYMIWSITQHKLKACITDWRELWVDEAFWHLLFSVLLLIIMILWRPTANNQRYAFSPLLDAAEDDVDDETVMNDAFDGMKMRSKNVSNGSPKQRETRKSVEDDLKWVEENIPSSISDKALPSLLDSDEELQNTHFEISKME